MAGFLGGMDSIGLLFSEEPLGPLEEALVLGVVLDPHGLGQFLQQFLLPGIELGRHLDLDVDEEIALAGAAGRVKGHLRHYKSGKTVWIDDYVKGADKK